MRNKLIRRTAIISAVLMVFLSLNLPVSALEYPTVDNAKYAYVMNIENGQVLFAKNETHKIYPASTVKLRTAVLSLEALGDTMKKKIVVPEAAVANVSGNNIGLQTGEVLTVEQLLYALIVGGANDAANVLAITIAGSIDAFVDMMNEKAKEIGAEDTTYKNPTGLHNDAMFTTVNDVAKIAIYAYGLPMFIEISGTSYYTIESTNMSQKTRRIVNKNYMVSTVITSKYYNVEVVGMNAGSTPQAGYCATEVQVKDGLAYLCVVMGASYDSEEDINYSYVTAQELLDWAFTSFNFVEVLSSTAMICEIPVKLSTTSDHVVLLPEHSVEVYLPSDIDLENDVERRWVLFEESLDAPVEMGQIVGELSLFFEGQNIGIVNLVAKNNVDRSHWVYIMDNIKHFLGMRFFKGFIITFIILSAIYVLAVAIIRQQIKNKRRKAKPGQIRRR